MMLDIGKVKKIGLFASGVLFGTAGVKGRLCMNMASGRKYFPE